MFHKIDIRNLQNVLNQVAWASSRITLGELIALPGRLAGGEGNIPSHRTPHLSALQASLFTLRALGQLAISVYPHSVIDGFAPVHCGVLRRK